MAVNNLYQLNNLHVLNREKTVDRKLNVALTRAQDYLFIVGNEAVLKQSSYYGALIGFCKEKGTILHY